MSCEHKSSCSDDACSSDTHTQQLVEEEFNEIFLEGVDPSLCYYKAYCQLYMTNLTLLNKVHSYSMQMKTLTEDNKELNNKVKEIWKPPHTNSKQEAESQGNDDKKKRCRRTAGEIARHYTCRYESCQKSYGSEGSLNQHIKLKHNGVPFSK